MLDWAPADQRHRHHLHVLILDAMTTDSSLGRWHSVPWLLALVLVCAGAVGMEAASPKASPLRSAEQTPAAPADTQQIVLEEGWNLISSRLVPDNPSMESVFAPIADAVEVVRGPSGAVYKPGDGTNAIGDWDVQAGYEVYVTSPQTLVIEGRLPVSNEADISLEKGWNNVSYLPNMPQEPTEALATIEGALTMVKDGTGDAFIPNEGIAQLEKLTPGQGFKVHVSTSQTLSYPESPLSSDLEYPTACLNARKSVPVGEYGSLTAGISADSSQRVANLEAINSAISNAPTGGAVCLPSDSLFVTFDQPPQTGNPGNYHIRINRDSVSLIGAGACGWGDLNGCTYIGTPGDAETYWYKGDIDDDGIIEVIRGTGIGYTANAGADSLRSLTLKGFEIDGNAGYTGNFSFNYENHVPEAEDGWDLAHKGISFSSGGDNMTDILVEDIKVRRYRGEVIYNGGFQMGVITARRIWSHDSNASAWNVATAKNQLVEDSKFGPDVRFWGEFLVEGIPDATSVHRDNTYGGCHTSNGCLAMAADNENNYADGQTWTWKNSTFTKTLSGNAGAQFFLLNSAPYSIDITNNTFQGGGRIFIGNGGAGQSSSNSVTIDISGNYLSNVELFTIQGGYYEGTVSNNTMTADNNTPQMFKAGGFASGLNIIENTVDGFAQPKGSSSPFPLAANNEYTTSLEVNIGGSQTVFHPKYDGKYPLQLPNFTGKTEIRLDLSTEAADGQRTHLSGFGEGTVIFPADSTQHAWENDISLSSSSDSVQIEFDDPSGEWTLIE